MLARRMQALGPHLRVLFVLFHVCGVVAMSLPAPALFTHGMGWDTPNIQAELRRWSETLTRAGVTTTPADIEARVRREAARYASAHAAFTAPFARYTHWSGARQGWIMFAVPQKHPGELHVDVYEAGAWRPVYRPHSAEHDFWGRQLRNHRLRKQQGSFGRNFDRGTYDGLVRLIARDAARAFPDATVVRVQLYRYATLAPAAVRAGETPEGHYLYSRGFVAAELREEPAP
ncbi:MAG: hypothetical protein KC593_04840 [Myxococcales bacterium]|nr:hypothetical protein [Myxococcales bacterium]